MEYFNIFAAIIGLVFLTVLIKKIIPASWELMYKLNKFQRDRADLDFHGRQDELFLRTIAAKLRRVSSERVIKSPGNADRIIEELIDRETSQIAATDPDAARAFRGWASNAPMGEILYPKAFNAVYKHQAKKAKAKRPALDEDLYASMRVKN